MGRAAAAAAPRRASALTLARTRPRGTAPRGARAARRRSGPAPRSAPSGARRRGPAGARRQRPFARVARARTSRVLDALLSGRGWIALVFLLLAGIVFFNVDLLQMNRDIAQNAETISALKRENARLLLEEARLANSERIQEEAAGPGPRAAGARRGPLPEGAPVASTRGERRGAWPSQRGYVRRGRHQRATAAGCRGRHRTTPLRRRDPRSGHRASRRSRDRPDHLRPRDRSRDRPATGQPYDPATGTTGTTARPGDRHERPGTRTGHGRHHRHRAPPAATDPATGAPAG